MNDLKSKTRTRQALPFAIAAAIWCVFGFLLSVALGSSAAQSLGWMGGLWLLSVIDLVALAGMIASLFAAMTGEDAALKPAHYTQALAWGALKLGCLGIFAMVLIAGKSAPSAPLLLGLATLIVVPLAGGFFWSRGILKEQAYA